MAPAAKSTTPGRRKKSDQQYFDVGKVGRKTGITLKDTGIRDEHGLEPVSGIFSSPAEDNGGKTLTSDSMDMQEGSAPDVTATLASRKTPRLPPPRQSPHKHTSIGGSPRRQSSARPVSRQPGSEEPVSSHRAHTQPPANRKLDFGRVNKDRKSLRMVETQSPFVPKHTLRRSTGHAKANPYDHPEDDEEDEEDVAKTSIEYTNNVIDEDDDAEQSIEDDGPIPLDDAEPEPIDADQSGISFDQAEAPAKRKRGRPRRSDQLNTSQLQDEPSILDATSSTNGRKRTRASLEHSRLADTTAEEQTGPSRKKKRNSNQETTAPIDDEETIDPSVLMNGGDDDVPLPDMDVEAQLNSQLDVEAEAEPEPSKKSKGRSKGKKGKAAATKQKEPSQALPNGSPVKLNESPSKLRGRGGSLGPVSNVTLRATTPFEDAGQHASRFGRNLIKPLKYWENESLIWKSGEIEGIIRAEHVDQSRPKPKRRKKSRKHNNRLRDIAEESETESTMPDEWEEAMGVITGNVANWNSEMKMGDANDPIQEGKNLGFAATSIVTRDVAGSDFKYAKIMTIPFFGAGIVELPPEGFKRAKNSRKMQMVFFVHSGKVMVEVGATGMEVNQFALSKGGVWIVPRGNNYAIANESRTKSAKIFFAQGCVVDGDV
ncbi:hypothetical protein AC578_2388 [Pseudocercospora eumusae]|uniref:Mif2/CENP-C cupin domain-containing protein n=1 Tax=Pseudocercospora eumusae TaxID=321146 RepID=A0A139HX93_9PEZI|nr:hypothetical protein AC578_2388 [Pseudocercospora eumusae]